MPAPIAPQPILASHEADHKAEQEICAICHVEYDEKDDVHTLPECSHKYHSSCIIQWLRTGNASCPSCRGHAAPERRSGLVHNATYFQMVSSYARRKTSPKPVQKLYEKYKKAKANYSEHSRILREFKKTHNAILKQFDKLRSLRYRCRRGLFIAKRNLVDIPVIPANI